MYKEPSESLWLRFIKIHVIAGFVRYNIVLFLLNFPTKSKQCGRANLEHRKINQKTVPIEKDRTNHVFVCNGTI